MPRTAWAMHFWPGMTAAWRGAWDGVAVALLFTILLNCWVLSTFVWVEWLGGGWRACLNLGLGGGWLTGVVWSVRTSRRVRADAAGSSDLFQQAQDEYLRGNWFEAEVVLKTLLRRRPRDVDAGLLLATLLRHTRRLDEASLQLDELQRIEGAQKWWMEIGSERRRIARAREDSPQEETPTLRIQAETVPTSHEAQRAPLAA